MYLLYRTRLTVSTVKLLSICVYVHTRRNDWQVDGIAQKAKHKNLIFFSDSHRDYCIKTGFTEFATDIARWMDGWTVSASRYKAHRWALGFPTGGVEKSCIRSTIVPITGDQRGLHGIIDTRVILYAVCRHIYTHWRLDPVAEHAYCTVL